MLATFVRAAAACVLVGVWVTPAEAQRLRFGVSVRVSDDVVASFDYGHRHPVYVSVYDDRYRHRRIKRHRKAHRRLERQHDRFHRDLAYDHDELHYELGYYDPVTARRVHRQWHRDAAYVHDHAHYDLNRKHKRVHQKLRKGHKHKHRH